MTHVLCSISTKGRYHTTLLGAIQSVVMQTRWPEQLIVFDDNDDPIDVRAIPEYDNLFKMMDFKGIQWEWIWSTRSGQHHNHQMANQRAREWVWRVDDDCIAEPRTLETLLQYVGPQVGGIGGSCLTPSWDKTPRQATGKMEFVDQENSLQWGIILQPRRVEHLHCSFLYRAGVADYHLGLSKVAHREETLFSWSLHKMGYELWVVPNAVTWHLKSDGGGIRSTDQNIQEFYDRDDQIFRGFMQFANNTIVVLDNGMGDHIVFRRLLPKIKNPVVFSCYPDIVPGGSIAEAHKLFGNIDNWNIYKKMTDWKWTDSLEKAFAKLYGVES